MSVTSLEPINPPIAVFGRHVESEVTTMVILDEMFETGVSCSMPTMAKAKA